ncbi:MAG: type II secretion system F family protein [Terrimicrobiaceae bacterium]|nr:type II secretion system F family protein [Terrimicrobiaceae bacterium]
METFRFRASNEAGTLETGTLAARSKIEAYDQLRVRKLRPVSIEIERTGPAAAPTGSSTGSQSVGPVRTLANAQLLLFTEEMSELLESGLQLEPALRIIESRGEKSALQPVAVYLRQQVRDGVSFSNALRSCGKCFSELFCSMVAAGEAAGALPRILRRQAEYFAIMADLRKRVVMALIYPSIVFSAGIVLLVIFMTFLLPALTDILKRTDQQLPLMTRLLIGTSEFFGHYWWAVLVLIGLLASTFTWWRRTPEGHMTWDRASLRLPLLGKVLRGRFYAEFSQTLSTLVANGVTLLNGLVLLERATPNLHIKKLLVRLAERVGEGSSLSSSMRALAFFPPELIDMITVGEQTGNIAGALERSAKRYDREFNNQIAQVTNLIQPVTILVVALFVGMVAYSMITGILTSVSGLRTRQTTTSSQAAPP